MSGLVKRPQASPREMAIRRGHPGLAGRLAIEAALRPAAFDEGRMVLSIDSNLNRSTTVAHHNGADASLESPLATQVDPSPKWATLLSEWVGSCDGGNPELPMTITIGSGFNSASGQSSRGLPYSETFSAVDGESCGPTCWHRNIFALRGPR